MLMVLVILAESELVYLIVSEHVLVVPFLRLANLHLTFWLA